MQQTVTPGAGEQTANLFSDTGDLSPEEQARHVLEGPCFVLDRHSAAYPEILREIPHPPERLYGVGNPGVLVPGLAVIGSRKATSYGLGCAKRFSRIAAEKDIVVISGGARGCDSAAHLAAVEAGKQTVVVLGGGCDRLYPASNFQLFQRVIDTGGVVISEYPWDCHPQPYQFLQRNRIIAGIALITLITEAGLPSGTFSTADEALAAGREVFAVPGSVTSPLSAGANRLIYQGAVPVIDDETFQHELFRVFGTMCSGSDRVNVEAALNQFDEGFRPLLREMLARPRSLEEVMQQTENHEEPSLTISEVLAGISKAEALGLVERYADGRIGPNSK